MKDISFIINHLGEEREKSFDEERTKEGFTNNLVRFYVGLDDPESLIVDLEQAFDRISRRS
jgi:cystathionine beta-lyase/cystathionine gamma-synthase